MGLHEGMVIAIPVLTRHINTSSGKCAPQNGEGEDYSSNCVMADALRDRFPDITRVSVGTTSSDFTLADGTNVGLVNQTDMTSVVKAFDRELERVRDQRFSDVKAWLAATKQALRNVRDAAPRVVHARVEWVERN